MQFYIPVVLAFLAGSTTAQIRRCPFNGGSIPFGQYVCSGPRVNGFPGNGISQCAINGQIVQIGSGPCPHYCNYISGIPYCF
ncbi:uncharacterized protein EAF02_010716 [Botrytis sinoallii]|uniref:Uncharacterized protein n=1 Tax=Botrytis galanthina TaxID=278940 RepID=A0A4S8R9C4_9HELO|nr:uncharacterized protein EAF02_010716 [Botrytis sinoallii]KAF7861762.1 hypothetical protein EAF02_010716 [Botrytis sinoallii]KAF7882242.1 hypothetical protein EAF00_011758 [Botryotinia globosa]THV53632.1 hypothetical protein BGAL_0046g00380 [Botrytis galanthina]